MSKIYLADYTNKQLVEKEVIEPPKGNEPIVHPFKYYAKKHYHSSHPFSGPDEEYNFDANQREMWLDEKEAYDNFIATQAKYPATWLTLEMDGKGFVEGKDFEIVKQVVSSEIKHTPLTEYNQAEYICVTLPLQSPSNKEIGIVITDPVNSDQQPEEGSAYLQSKSDKPVQANFMQVVPDSHSWDNLGMFIHWLEHKERVGEMIFPSYLLTGLKNTLARGLDLRPATPPLSAGDVEQNKNWKDIISDRILYFSKKYHSYEAGQLIVALKVIDDLIPPSSWQSSLNQPVLSDGLLDILVWYQGKGDEYREQTLLVDCVKDFLIDKNK